MWIYLHAILPVVKSYFPVSSGNLTVLSYDSPVISNSVVYPYSWFYASVYCVLVLVLNNVIPYLGSRCLLGSVLLYLLQGVPLCLGLTGFSPHIAANQLFRLFLQSSPDNLNQSLNVSYTDYWIYALLSLPVCLSGL